MGQKSGSEITFVSSFMLLVGALLLIFIVMNVYRPLESSHIVNQNAASGPRIVERSPSVREVSRTQLQATKHDVQPKKETSKSDNLHDSKTTTQGVTNSADNKSLASGSTLSATEIEEKLTEAMKLVDNGNPQAAMSVLEKVLAADPTNELALVEMGMIYLIDYKDPSGAMGYLEKALKTNPNNKVVLSELVGIYDELGQTEAGLNFLQNLYDENPDNSQLALGLGQVMVSQDRINDALPYLEKAADDLRNPSAVTEYADALSEVGQGEKAVEAYKKVLDIEIERAQSGYYDNQPGASEEKIAMARMDLIGEYLAQKNEAKAQEQLEKLRSEIKNDEAMAALLEQFRERKGVTKQ